MLNIMKGIARNENEKSKGKKNRRKISQNIIQAKEEKKK